MDATQNWLDAYPVAAPRAPPAGGGRPTLTPLGPPHAPPPPQSFGWDRHPDGSVTPTRGGPNDPNRFAPTGDTSRTGADYAPTIPDPTLRALAQSFVDGRIPWPASGRQGSPRIQQAMAEALQIDPSLDANASTMRRHAETQFTGGGQGALQIQSANRVANHLAFLRQASDRLTGPDTGFSPANTALATVGQLFEPSDATTYDSLVDGVAKELQRYFRPAGGTGAEVDSIISNLGRHQSADQRVAAMAAAARLIEGGIRPLADNYNSAFVPGTTRPRLPWLSPSSLETYRNLGVDMSFAADAQMNPGAPGGAPPNPSGTQPPNPPERGGPGGGPQSPGGLGGALRDVAHGNGASPAPTAAEDGANYRIGQQMLAAPSGSEERFQMLERYHNASSLAKSQMGFGHEPESEWRDSFGVTASQSQALEREYQMATRARAIAARAAAEPAGISPVDILPPVLLARMVARGLSGDEAANAVQRGATDTLTMGGADEATAALASAGGNGTYDENVAIQRGIADYDSRNHPISRFAGQFAGGLALPVGEAPTLGRLAATGAGYGAAYGLGSGEGVTDRLIRAGEGGAAGVVLAPGIKLGADAAGTAFRALRSLGSSSSSAVADAGGVSPQDLIGAANRQNVDVLPADVSGPGVRRVTAGMAQLPFGSGPIINAAQRTTNQVGARVGELAATEGAPARQEALGKVARDAAQGYIDRSGAEGTRLYDAARAATSDATTSGTGAMGAVDSHIAELSSTASTSAPEISALQRLRSDIADEVKPASQAPTGVLDAQGNPIMRATEETGGPRAMSIDALRRLRTNVRAMSMEEGLRGTDFQRRANDVLSHLSDDISQGLPPEAAGAFREADAHWAHRLNVIDDVMSNIIGPQGSRSPEQVTQRLVSMSRSDSGRLKAFIDHATDEEGGVIRSSLINELGRAPSGQQGAQGDKFSLSTFLTNWDLLPERSRNILFRGDSRAAIEDLATVAEGSREAGKYANRSNTGGAVNTGDIMRGLSVYSAWGSAGASAIVENLTGRLLASPRFARWLARPAADAGTRMRRLAQIVAREPQLASDIIPIQSALARFSDGGARSAAAQNTQDAGSPPVQQ